MRKTIWLSALLLGAAGPALAHPGHETSGFLHPFSGLDHMLAMVGVGLWAALLAGRKPVITVAVPAAFLAMMAIGAAAGFAGIKLPLVEATILASVFVIGGLIIGAVRLPVVWAMAVVGLFAVFHGYAHALEAPPEGAGDSPLRARATLRAVTSPGTCASCASPLPRQARFCGSCGAPASSSVPATVVLDAGPASARHVAVEVKRRAGIDAVEQLTRYLELLNRDPHLAPVRGVLAAQSIAPQAKTLAGDRGIDTVVLDYDAMKGVDDSGSRLF